MNKGRSLGIYAFRTPPSHHLEYGGKFQTLIGQGNIGAISSMMRVEDTIATEGGCSYDEKHYLEWSSKIYNQHISARWERNYWLDEVITFWNNSAFDKLRKHYNDLKMDYNLFREMFIPIKWTTGGVTMTDIKSYLEYLTTEKFYSGIAVRNLALEEKYGRTILYAKKSWLQKFQEGQQMINYYTMATNFKEVYGF